MKTTIITFSDAEILSKNGRNIGVFYPRTGQFWGFEDAYWYLYGSRATENAIEIEIGEAGMDQEYVFIWIH